MAQIRPQGQSYFNGRLVFRINGTMKATVDTICKIAQALDLRPSELFAMVEERQDKDK